MWRGVAAGGRLAASRQERNHTTIESRYYLLSCSFSRERVIHIVGEHWGIENCLHLVLDVVFNKDPYLNRKDHCLDSLAFLRKLALNLVRLEPSKGFIGVGSVPAVVGALTGSVARGVAGQELNASVDGKWANQSEDAQGIPLVMVKGLAHDLKMRLTQ